MAWFAQGSGNRTDFGLTPPVPDAVHNRHAGGGAAGKVWLLPRSTDVLTFTGSYRSDDYQIPRDPSEEVLFENLQVERDAFVNGLWTHSTSGPGVWSVAPYYHLNRVALNPEGLVDLGASIDDRRIHYVGAKVDWSWSAASHQVRIGTNAYGSFLHDVFSLPVGEEGVPVADQVSQSGLNAAIYVAGSLSADPRDYHRRRPAMGHDARLPERIASPAARRNHGAHPELGLHGARLRRSTVPGPATRSSRPGGIGGRSGR